MTPLSVLVLCVTILHSATSYPAHTELKANGNNLGIIGGERADIKDAPFMAALMDLFCTGSIIHEQFILTAAHCCEGVDATLVKVGSGSLKGYDEQIYASETIVAHENYGGTVGIDYDICVIKLNDTLTFGPTVGKIILADDTVELNDGTQLTVLGWGAAEEGGNIEKTLRTVNVPFVSKRRCRDEYNGVLTANMLCAGDFNKDTCQGDSGGPLTFMNAIQVGVTSFGYGCGRHEGVYTNVAAMLPWIKKTISDLSE